MGITWWDSSIVAKHCQACSCSISLVNNPAWWIEAELWNKQETGWSNLATRHKDTKELYINLLVNFKHETRSKDTKEFYRNLLVNFKHEKITHWYPFWGSLKSLIFYVGIYKAADIRE